MVAGKEQKEHIRGWLVNKSRRENRDTTKFLTDIDVKKLIQKIDSIENYTRLKDVEKKGKIIVNRKIYDDLIRMRDKALIALSWIFFKRASETLGLKLRNVVSDGELVSVTFKISKKSKRVKNCLKCGKKNSLNAKYCKNCGVNISKVEIVLKGDPYFIRTKTASAQTFFSKQFIMWIETLKNRKCNKDDHIFPPYNRLKNNFLFGKRLTTQRLDQIIQRLDSTLTSHLFRYAGAEKYLRLGYTISDVMDIGDWASSAMPIEYARRKGITPAGKKFAEEKRVYE